MKSAAGARDRSRKPADSANSAVKTLRKALTILDAFAAEERPLSVAEVAERAGVTRPTAHRLVQTLLAGGYLVQDSRDSRLSPGYSVLKLAGRLLDSNRIRLESMPHLQTMASESGERANLGILHNGEMLYLAGAEKPSLPTIYTRFGRTTPAHCSSIGKAILAFLPEHELADFLDGNVLAVRTEHTLSDPDDLRPELARIRQQGFAIDREELAPNLFGLASPILIEGRPAAAIGLSGRILEPLLTHKDMVLHAAEVISHVLSRGG